MPMRSASLLGRQAVRPRPGTAATRRRAARTGIRASSWRRRSWWRAARTPRHHVEVGGGAGDVACDRRFAAESDNGRLARRDSSTVSPSMSSSTPALRPAPACGRCRGTYRERRRSWAMVARLMRQSKSSKPAPGGAIAISVVLPPPFFQGSRTGPQQVRDQDVIGSMSERCVGRPALACSAARSRPAPRGGRSCTTQRPPTITSRTRLSLPQKTKVPSTSASARPSRFGCAPSSTSRSARFPARQRAERPARGLRAAAPARPATGSRRRCAAAARPRRCGAGARGAGRIRASAAPRPGCATRGCRCRCRSARRRRGNRPAGTGRRPGSPRWSDTGRPPRRWRRAPRSRPRSRWVACTRHQRASTAMCSHQVSHRPRGR